jgi:hypothetical protein
MTTDWNILARYEGVHAEAISGLVVVGCVRIVAEHASRVLRPARLVHESPHFFVGAAPKLRTPQCSRYFCQRWRSIRPLLSSGATNS